MQQDELSTILGGKIMIKISKGNPLVKTTNFLKKSLDIKRNLMIRTIRAIGDVGVKSLEEATPKKTGKTSKSWTYEIEETENTISVNFNNTNVVNGVNIAVILQYGHGTKNGGYVAGRDYINPALKPIFDKMADDMWKAVMSL